METYRENYIDLHTRKVHSITSLKSDEHLRLVNKDKLITHRYIFAPVIYSGHWWMYVLDKEKKTFFVVDSKRKDAPSSDRTRINKFAGNMIDQLLVYAGYHSLLTKGTRSKPPQISWFPRYQQIHEQPNAYDCGTFVMKWMEILDPTKLDAHSRRTSKGSETTSYGKSYSPHKTCTYKRPYRGGAIETTIHKPSAALRSPYVQVNTDELKKLP
ncbi:hypothetical protein PIB30_061117 [Stylosanthes scabra]|uniref:Ubiquitin-like protease family profile domain-containing protein n=1 Tax=Stylosanthes scabra TaxID=79078 RepID=A0ABU6YJN0_9FABA|nr:hypothetical protein [Stylosanthes scabra]